MFLAGYVLLLAAYLVLLLAPRRRSSRCRRASSLLGAFYAATDGVLMALAGATLPSSHVGSGIALITTAIALARLVVGASCLRRALDAGAVRIGRFWCSGWG